MVLIGFLVNPIAGIGGKVGLKGTDGEKTLGKATKLGGKPIAPKKAIESLDIIKSNRKNIKFLTCSGDMGENELKRSGFSKKDYEIVYKSGKKTIAKYTKETGTKTTAKDTKKACEKFLKETKENIDLILFCGGDGTARDVVSVVGERVPIIGIPAGVKMYSGIFAETPSKAGLAVVDYANFAVSTKEAETIETEEVEIVDIDENEYRKGNLRLAIYGKAKTICDKNIIQVTKGIIDAESEEDKKAEIGEHIIEMMEKEKDTFFILGPGTTTEKVTELLGIKKSLIGVSIIKEGKLIADDVNEKNILTIINKMKNKNKIKIIISPIGNQGFIFGRGNQQLSADVIKKVGIENIIVIATPNKLKKIDTLRVDTGDRNLDKKFKGFWKVVIGYGRWRMCKVA
ncbi:MAG: ATP-NAD kinase family protein [Thermoplasmata archaeon]